jgi:uncharacterized membrane protein YqjE
MQGRARLEHDGGFFSHASSWLSAALTYLRARLQLAGMEGKEASVHYLLIVALLIGALVVVVFGYFFFCLFLVFLLALAFGGGQAWIWVTLGMALLHFGLAAACAIMAKNKFAQPKFEATMEEFRKDQEWLNSKTARPL